MDSHTGIRPRWTMLVSHHPPSQYDRTLHIGRIRICARCAGLIVGLVVAGIMSAFLSRLGIFSATAVLLGILFVLSGGIAVFVLNEANIRQSNNLERIVFGFVLGTLLILAWRSSVFVFFAALTFTLVGQFFAAFWLRKLDVLDKFVNEYLEGAKILPNEGLTNNSCGRLLCRCNSKNFRLPIS